MSKKNEVVENTAVQTTDKVVKDVYGIVTLPKEFKELNIRAEANANSKVMYKVKPKTRLKIAFLDNAPEWVKVIGDDDVGYCMKKYVKIK